MSGWRLSAGGREIDRERRLDFEFDGRFFQGFAGDTVASALLAAGLRVLGRSFKRHRPRGLMGLGWEDPCALMQLLAPDRAPNVPAGTLPLAQGMRLQSVNAWPSARADLMGLLDLAAPWIPAGFYYKTFMGPARAWPLYERLIRRAAGLGRLPATPSPVRMRKRHAHADILVVGAGPAGAAAALTAAQAGARVLWVDDGLVPGGSLRAQADDAEDDRARQVRATLQATPASDDPSSGTLAWVRTVAQALDALPGVRRLSGTLAQSRLDHGLVVLWQRSASGLVHGSPDDDTERSETLWSVRVPQVILATGGFEQPMLFPDNDRPGVMLASAVRGLIHRHGVAAARRLVVVGSDDDALACALDAQAAGVDIAAWVDTRATIHANLRAAAEAAGIEVLAGHRIESVAGGAGPLGFGDVPLRSVRVVPREGGPARTLHADGVAMAGGWNPALQLLAQLDGALRWDPLRGSLAPTALPEGLHLAGAARGTRDTAGCIADGVAAARAAVGALAGRRVTGGDVRHAIHADVHPRIHGEIEADGAEYPAGDGTGADPPHGDDAPRAAALPDDGLTEVLALPPRQQRQVFVDRGHDVSVADIALGQREGYTAVEHLKRYTTLGMAVDQGRTSQVHGMRLMAALEGVEPAAVGASRLRPPFVPMPLGLLAGAEAGDLIRPVRETPLTGWHLAHGAVMYEAGSNWRRPGYHPRDGESLAQAAAREARAVRQAAGLYDSTPLGKFEIEGPQAGLLLEAVCANRVADLEVGRGRYAVLLKEDGRMLDDGVVFRLGPQRYLLTATAGQSDTVHAWLEHARQCVLPWLQGRAVPGTPPPADPSLGAASAPDPGVEGETPGPARAFVTAVGAQWATIVLCGPRAREILRHADTDIDLERAAFPFMALREGRVAGVAARVLRVSFTGELSFEVNVAAGDGLRVWQALWDAGQPFGLQAVGSEANHILRVEKGFISMAHEADGIVTPIDLGLGWAVKMDKPFFIGQAALRRLHPGPSGIACVEPDQGTGRMPSPPKPRPELVGLQPLDDGGPLEEGAQLWTDPGVAMGAPAGGSDDDSTRGVAVRPDGTVVADAWNRSEGFVTASVIGAGCGQAIALALLDGGRSRHGETVRVSAQPAHSDRATARGPGLRTRLARVGPPAFHDPSGEAMRG